MAQVSYSDITSIVSGGGSIPCNGSATDSLFIDPKRSTGLGGRRVRAPIDNRPQDHGYILHPDFFREGQHIVLGGLLDIRSAGFDPGYVTARDALIATIQAVLDGMHAATGTVNFGSGGALTVKNDTGYDFPREAGPVVGCIFGLVTAT